MRKRIPITEDIKLKEAHALANRMSRFLDEEIARWEAGAIDREMLCAAITTWQSANREIFRIENDKKQKELKWKPQDVPNDL